MVIHRSIFPITLLLLATGWLSACSDSGDSPGAHPGQPGHDRPSDLLTFQAFCCSGEGHRGKLFKYSTDAGLVLLSDNAGFEENAVDNAVSPDGKRFAYNYNVPSADRTLKVLDIASTRLLHQSSDYENSGIRMDWSPDSRQLLYYVNTVSGRGDTLVHLDVDSGTSTELLRGELRYDISEDFSLLAVEAQREVSGVPTRELTLIDLAGSQPPQVIDSSTGAQQFFRFEWAPAANELLYQLQYHFSAEERTYGPSVEVDGPLMLLTEDGQRQELLSENDNFPSPFEPLEWLNEQNLLLRGTRQFMVLGRDANVLHEQSTSNSGTVAPSPDGSLLAFINYAKGDRERPEIQILNIQSGDVYSAGPASEFSLGRIGYAHSLLRWSDDSSLLAWSRRSSYEEMAVEELYIHDPRSRDTQLVTEARHRNSDFSWLSGELLLEYVEASGAGLELILDDPVAQTRLNIGTLAANSEVPCRYTRAWRSRSEVLWNHCADGVYHSRVTDTEAVVSEKVYGGDLERVLQSQNLEYAVTRSPDWSGIPSPGRLLIFDFITGEMTAVELPKGHSRPQQIRTLH